MTGKTSGGVSVVQPLLDEKPWGGQRIADYGFPIPQGTRIGEALVTRSSTSIASGSFAGATLGDAVQGDSDDLLGLYASKAVGGRAVFPVLVKLIDASDNLSIQVHPGDDQAARHDGLGKTEVWHVLAAAPGSWLYAGLRVDVSSDEFLAAADRLDGSSASLLRRIPAQPGTTILLPAGTIHALGAGVMVYELQQPSNLTYRLDDWGRTDAEGNPRETHREAGRKAMRVEFRPDLIAPVEIPANEGRRHLLAACDKFALERIALPGGGRHQLAPTSGPQVLTLLSGAGKLADHALTLGQSGVVWPDSSPATFWASMPTVALRAWVPDLVTELEEWASTPGIDPDTLFRLSGPLPDIRRAVAT